MSKPKTAGEQVVEGLRDLLDAVKKGQPLQDRFAVRTYLLSIRPRRYGPKDVKALRRKLGMSQAVFAQVLAVSPKTVQAWERSGVARPWACRHLEMLQPWWERVGRARAG